MYIFLLHAEGGESVFIWRGRENREAKTACEDTCELFSSTLRCNRKNFDFKGEIHCSQALKHERLSVSAVPWML